MKRSLFVIFVMFCILFVGCANTDIEHSDIDTIKREDDISEEYPTVEEPPETSEIVKDDTPKVIITESKDLTREDEFNTIEVLFYDRGKTKIPMDIEIDSIYSTTKAYYSLDDAVDAGVIKEFSNKDGRLTLLLKNEFNLNGIFNPSDTSKVAGWQDYKANYPFEVGATLVGNNRLTRFEIHIDYKSELAESKVTTSNFN